MECLRKQLLDVLADGLNAAAEQAKELGPSEDEDIGQMKDQGLRSIQVKSIFDLSYIWADISVLIGYSGGVDETEQELLETEPMPLPWWLPHFADR